MGTVDSLITEVKLKGGFPTDNYFTDAEMLVLMNSALKTVITPLILKIKEEFLLQTVTHTITSGSTYRMPKRAVGGKLRDVKYLNNGEYSNLNRLFEEDRALSPSGYYISRNSIELSDDFTSGTLSLNYFLNPSTLILEASAAKVLSIDSATQVTVTALPSTITTSTQVDFVQGVGPYDLLAINQTISSISGTTLTFSDLPDDLAVNDYISLAGYSPVATIPEQLHPLLVQATLYNSLISKKDSSSKEVKMELEEMKKELMEMLDTRVESNDIKLNGQGLLSYIRGR